MLTLQTTVRRHDTITTLEAVILHSERGLTLTQSVSTA